MSIRALQVSFFLDREGRAPEELLAAWPALSGVARATREAGVDVSVLQAATEDQRIEQDGVTYDFVRERSGKTGTMSWPRRLIGRAAALQPDVVHVHGLGFPVQTRLLKNAVPRARILVQDHCDHPPRRLLRPLHRWGLAVADAVLFTEASLGNRFVRAGVLSANTRILEALEVSTDFTTGDLDDARRRTGLEGDPCLLWVGRLNRNKDPLTILNAVALAALRLPQAQLYMCYTHEALLNEINTRISSEPALQGRVHLLGKVPHIQMQDLYRSADFFVLGSAHEGSGFAILEAMACGVAPIVTDIPAFRAITGGNAGALFPVGDAVACADAIMRLATRDRRALRAQTLARFQNALTYQQIGKQLRLAYEAVLQ
jgi:glycosyltransferase involved in cell wall biosynthesis